MQENKIYQVISKKYRPQRFCEVAGQAAIVKTLKNGIKFDRLANAYLFAGSRGTGKTTLARLFAKALNCRALSQEMEPCMTCPSCLEIQNGSSLDVIEIDGASHRGIEEMRRINETITYACSTGRYKIYIIDEVHMLTKEAFNAMLKTLEEPPPFVKFFFATTEPHKVLPTIISRCQRFNLHRLSPPQIVNKLDRVVKDLERSVSPEALHMIAERSEGALRDAESLLDQLLCFFEGEITGKEAAELLGVVSQHQFLELDKAGKEGNLAKAFELANSLYEEGKDLSFFIQSLTEHYRKLLLLKCGSAPGLTDIAPEWASPYQASSELYLKEQLLDILELCLEADSQIRTAASPRLALEGLLLSIMRTHRKIPLDHLVQQLHELQKKIEISSTLPPVVPKVEAVPPPAPTTPTEKLQQPEKKIDPSPTPPKTISEPKHVPKVEAEPSPPPPIAAARYDTLLQFAAVELEGKITKG